jgi:hypothetical protein
VQLQATAELSAMVEMARILASTMDLRRLLQNSLERIVHSFDGARSSLISLRQLDGRLKLARVYGSPTPRNWTAIRAGGSSAGCESKVPVDAWDGRIAVLGGFFRRRRSYRTLASAEAEDALGGLALAALARVSSAPSSLAFSTPSPSRLPLRWKSAHRHAPATGGKLEDLVRQPSTPGGGATAYRSGAARRNGPSSRRCAMGLAAVEANLAP